MELYRASSTIYYTTFTTAFVCLLSVKMRFYYSGTRNSPRSYRQSHGRGQLLSRRYCTHSVWLFLCASRTASSSQGALAVSCKYFKQSKWPFLAACAHAYCRLIFIILTLNKIFEYMKMTILAAHEAVRRFTKALWTSSCKYLRHSR